MSRKLMIFLLPLLIGCQPKKPEVRASSRSRILFVSGDPREFIRGTTLNSRSPIKLEDVNRWSQIRLMSMFGFAEKNWIDSDQASIAQLLDKTFLDTAPIEVSTINGQTIFQLRPKLSLVLEKTQDGLLQAVGLIVEGKSIQINVLHWSQDKQRKLTSLLFETHSASLGNALGALYFQEPIQGNYPQVDLKDTRWNTVNNVLPVGICGAEGFKDEIYQAAAKWNRVLGGRLQIQPYLAKSYPPFTDLSSHCIYDVKSYMTIYSREHLNTGLTVKMDNFEIEDADTFLLESEMNKSPETLAFVRAQTVLHEMGHFIGIDHPKEATNAVMNKQAIWNLLELQPYDISSAQRLYR